MHDIQLNDSGTRHPEVSDENLRTVRKYDLFSGLVDSTGYVTEEVLEKLKLNVRSLIAHSTEDTKDLLDLCIDVIYHDKMKAYGLKNLIDLYKADCGRLSNKGAAGIPTYCLSAFLSIPCFPPL